MPVVDEDYVRWLRQESMLADASRIAGQFSGIGSVWQSPYATPNPGAAVEKSSVWFTAYPMSMITKAGGSFLGTLADEDLWRTFAAVGISAVHTGPLKRAGGVFGREMTPSVDGHFDRISTRIDEVFGTEPEFRRMCEVAAAYGAIVIDDIVPGHTGKGADFRLAEMKVGDYPGIYHMVEIPPTDWHLLPEVPAGKDSVNLDGEAEHRLERAGHIVGRLQRVIFQEPGVKETNWSATAPVTGQDGVERRWVYLHYFKDGQPSINWLDPTFAGMRLVIGDALHSLGHLGAGALRLDANGFLGVEKSDGEAPAWSEGHPLSEAVNQVIASMVRKVGKFTFQELNLSIDDIKKTSDRGADLSYDFVNRPAYVHALATGDTEFLRLTLKSALQHGLQPVRLVHALQNHDEMTYELVHFAIAHKDDVFRFRGAELTGEQLAVTIRSELVERLTGEAAPYNAIFTTNGIASTIPTIIAATLGYRDITSLLQPAERTDQAGPPAPGDVQRDAAWRVRSVWLGPLRNADPGAVQGLETDRDRRHPMDPSGCLRFDGLSAASRRVIGRPTAWCEPLRIPAGTVEGRHILCVTTARPPDHPRTLQHFHCCSGGRSGCDRQRHAGDGPSPPHRADAGQRAELRQPFQRRQDRVGAPATGRRRD